MLTEPFERVANPLRIEGAPEALGSAATAGWFILLPSLLLAAVSLVVRFRRSGAVERQQLKLVASTGVFFALAFLVEGFAGDTGSAVFEALAGALAVIALAAIPIAAGIAILRYRLYEIDLIIRRTLVYGALTAALAGLYFGIVLALQEVFSSFAGGSDLAVAVSTLAVAALFRPARRRIQALGRPPLLPRRYDAQRTLEAFSAPAARRDRPRRARPELTGVVQETMQPAHVSLWLRPTGVSGERPRCLVALRALGRPRRRRANAVGAHAAPRRLRSSAIDRPGAPYRVPHLFGRGLPDRVAPIREPRRLDLPRGGTRGRVRSLLPGVRDSCVAEGPGLVAWRLLGRFGGGFRAGRRARARDAPSPPVSDRTSAFATVPSRWLARGCFAVRDVDGDRRSSRARSRASPAPRSRSRSISRSSPGPTGRGSGRCSRSSSRAAR